MSHGTTAGMLDRVPVQLKLAAFLGLLMTGPVVVAALLLFGVWGAVAAILAISLLYTILYFVTVRRHL